MKSNQERSNGCLPPKKREILALEQRPIAVATATPPADPAPHAESLAWLASLASERCRSRDAESPRCLAPVTSDPPPALPLPALPAVFPPVLQPHAGTIQLAQLGPGVQLISSGPYAGYISSHIISSGAGSPAPASQRPPLDGYATAVISPAKTEQQLQMGLSSEVAPVPATPHVSGQFIHLDGGTPLTVGGAAVTSTTGHLQIHPHTAVLPQTLTLAPSQLVVRYADGSVAKKPDGPSKVFNGELEAIKSTKVSGVAPQSYEARHILLPADYGQNAPGLQTSLVLVAQPSPSSEPESNSSKLSLTEKSGVCLGKALQRTSSFYSPPPEVKSVSANAVVHTSVPPDELPSIIGYITSGSQHSVSYHAALPQHLVLPGGPSLLIPVTSSGSDTGPLAAAPRHLAAAPGPLASAPVPLAAAPGPLAAAPVPLVAPGPLDAPGPLTAPGPLAPTGPQISTAMPHAFLTTALSKCEAAPHGVAHGPVAAPPPTPPVVCTVAPAVAASSPAPASGRDPPVALPPFFMRGSIIQLADGELKRVEDLQTEDFIQSAEVSSELKIDSSTVERIDSGQSPNAVVIQFSVGELKAQVCVEVLVEYPFFVFGQGWSSCCPDRTTQLFELSCAKLCVGDVCVSLTLRGLRNGVASDPHTLGTRLSHACHNMETALRTGTRPGIVGGNGGLRTKPQGQGPQEVPGLRTTSGPGGVPPPAGSGEAVPDSHGKMRCSGSDRVRKRRWSAPEQDQRSEGEPALSLARPSMVPQEVKVSIEGRSSAGQDCSLVGSVDC